jgi:outer membrane protein OmpA-like peptidoglycan-associated protein
VKLARTCAALALAADLALVVPTARAAECDAENTKDIPLFTRMPNYCITETTEKEFDAYQMFDGKKVITVEGRVQTNYYTLKEGATSASELQIRRNYENALKKMGAAFVYDGRMPDTFEDTRSNADQTVGRIEKGGSAVWLEVSPFSDGSSYYLTVVQVEAMKQDVTAGELLKALQAEGHVALYITFDTGKATIKPESQAVIDQVAEMLKGSPDLKLGVEGHTDNVGAAAANKSLSESRAQAVAAALAAKGIDPKRLATAGWGQEKPIADNKTDEGRAKNRRVELVRK